MSDEEEVYSDEEYEEEEEVEEEIEEAQAEEEEEAAEDDEERTENLNEAEKAMLAAKKRHEEDDQAKLEDYEQRRRAEREKEEEELRKLKEKQEQRKLAREQEEREAAERKRADEERRKKEEEERRARAEEDKRKKEEEKLKKAQMMGGGFTPGQQGGRNFVINKKADTGVGDRFGNIVQAKQEMGMTKEQQEEAKEAFLVQIRKTLPAGSEILPNDLKSKIKELHQRICKLEAQKYDQEKRHERQVYDLKELNERSRQVARANNAKNGQSSNDDTGGRFPAKIQVFSKYDRQIDRRNFKERRAVYENKIAFPCFPGIAPPPALYEKVIKKLDYEIQQELDAAEEEEEEEDY
ncbi:unnamed protein product [Caenorhabditis angaria]|uniref:Troponin T n=1 Tax=Caenorhabditis angaria TaxID=860376 RepID=A0A9P1ITR7_9PELO|nr:unnamed protein product [Caenorhabditis angaria]